MDKSKRSLQRVKFFSDKDIDSLERTINSWLDTVDPVVNEHDALGNSIEIVDMKFTSLSERIPLF